MLGTKRVRASSWAPAKRSKSKVTKFKKSNYKRPALAARSNGVTPVGGDFGNRVNATLIYSDLGLSGTSNLGVPYVKVMSLNSLYDPDHSGVGHQPVGFDQIMAIYEQYLVKSVKYKAAFVGSTAEIMIGATVSDSATAQSDARVYIENGMTVWKVITAGNSNNRGELDGYVDLSKVHGISFANYLEAEDYKGTSTTNPHEQAFLHLWAVAFNGNAQVNINLAIEMTMFSVFTGGKLNALS